MNAILSQFSLAVLIRQFFCGVVFFLPALLAGCGDAQFRHVLLKPESSFAVGLFIVLSCIVGTIIHHLEKNTYSYALQGLFCFCGKAMSETTRKFSSCLVFLSLGVMIVVLACAYCMCICAFLFFLTVQFLAVLSIFSLQLVEVTQKSWVISGISNLSRKELNLHAYPRERFAILKRLDTWSDNIHCVQSCCFAWLFGLWLAKYLVQQNGGAINILIKFGENSVEYCSCVNFSALETQLQNLDGWSVCLAFLFLFLEACFEWHRFQHILDITQNLKLAYTFEKSESVV